MSTEPQLLVENLGTYKLRSLLNRPMLAGIEPVSLLSCSHIVFKLLHSPREGGIEPDN
jgi:hypothetical protein